MNRFLQSLRNFELPATGKWILLAALIGVAAGTGAIVFQVLGQAIQHFALTNFSGFNPVEAKGEHLFFGQRTGAITPWAIVVVMAVGGLLSGVLVYTFAPEAEGPGTDAAIDSFHNERGKVRRRVPLIKTLASAITLGTGGSAGREGPIAQIGAGIGSFLADRLQLSARDRRIMLAVGMGAGVGAIFRAPLAGALFAGEILYFDADLEADVIVPSAVASTVGYCVYSLALPPAMRFMPLFGQDVLFEVTSVLELLPYTAMAFILIVISTLYIIILRESQRAFKKLPIVPHLRPMIGATLAGLTGLAFYYAMGRNVDALGVLGSGYGTLQKAFSSAASLSVTLLLLVAAVKIVTTSLTISSGGSGGVFGPSIVVGGCLGAAIGKLFNGWWPGVVTQPEAFAIVGMAGFFAGSARAPFSTILMVTEMTGNYRLLLPTMWVSSICFLVGRWTLYVKQVPTRLDSPAHRGDFLVDVLEGMLVADVYKSNRKRITIYEGTSLDEIVHMLAKTSQRYFPVVDSEDQMVGIFSAEDVRGYLYNDAIWQLADANDVMTTRVLSVTPEDDLNTALTRFTALNIDELPVVSPDNSKELLGMLRRKEVIGAYNRLLAEHKEG